MCVSSPLDWRRIPRAETRCRCYIFPNEIGWKRKVPPRGCNTVWPHLRRSPHAQIWSTQWPQRRCRPSCPARGQTAPQVAWKSWCAAPVYHQHRLNKTKKDTHHKQYIFMWTFIQEHINIHGVNCLLIFLMSPLSQSCSPHSHNWTVFEWQPHSYIPLPTSLTQQLSPATFISPKHGRIQ